MVEITGNFIYFDGKFTRTITAKDGPQSFDKSLEARLVSEGTARYVREVPDEDPAGKDLKDMTLAELKEHARELGLEDDVKSMRKKSDVIEAIEMAEEPPTFEV